MKIDLISHLYPNTEFPAKGPFIRQYHSGIGRHHDVRMLVPTIVAPPFTEKWRYATAPFKNGVDATRIRFISIPGGRFPGIVQRFLTKAVLPGIESRKPDLVHVNWIYPDGMIVPALKKKGYPVVLSVHGSDWYKTVNRDSHRPLIYEILRNTDIILTVGSRLKSDISKALPELKQRIRVSGNPVDFSRFQLSENILDLRNQLGWSSEHKHVLTVANLSEEKGIHVLLEAIRQDRRTDTVFHLIGNIPGTPYAKRMLREIETLPQLKLHAPVSHNEISRYYSACDLLVLPSLREGFGLASAEAIACGKPVVSTRCGGPEDIITKDNGKLVEPGNAIQLAEAINQILDDPKAYPAGKLRESVYNRFSSSVVFDKINLAYEEAVSISKKRQGKT